MTSLCRDDRAAVIVDELDRLGVLDHPGVRRLLAIARTLEGRPIDPMAWLDRARQESFELAGALERALFPEPGTILHDVEEAAEFLCREHDRERASHARRQVLSQGDLAHDGDALRALDESLRAARRESRLPPNSLPTGR